MLGHLRTCDRQPDPATSGPRVPALPRPDRPERARRTHGACRIRQCLHAPQRGDPALAPAPSPLQLPLHAGRQLLGDSGRAAVRETNNEVAPARRAHRNRPDSDHVTSGDRGARKPASLRLPQDRRTDPRQPRRVSQAYSRLRTLMRRSPRRHLPLCAVNLLRLTATMPPCN